MSGNDGFQVGNFVSPLTASTTNGSLEDADPAIFHSLNYFQAVIQAHLGARFDAEVTRAGLSTLVGRMTTLAIPYDPAPLLVEAQLVPPMLALFAVSDRPSEETRTWYHLQERWTMQWVLPPLTSAQYLQLYPFLRAVGKVVLDRNEIGYDPSYLSGALFSALAGLESIKIAEITYGYLSKPNTNLHFPCVEFEITAYERRMAAPGQIAFTGTDSALTVEGVDVADIASNTP